MSERIIPISPYVTADHLIDLSGCLMVSGLGEKIEIPSSKSLNLYNYPLLNGETLVPREHDAIDVYIKPRWISGRNQNDFAHLVLSGEATEKVLRLRLQAWCKTTKWCSSQIVIKLSEVSRKEIEFEVPVNEVKEEITISGFVTRESGGKAESRKASALYSIVSNCEDVVIQIDERKEIGGDHLPIYPENIGELLFDMDGLEDQFNLPVIKYSEDFKEFFLRDNLRSVNVTFMMSMFYFLDVYLRWLIFTCKYDPNDKGHRGLVETFSKYCGISKVRLTEIIEDEKRSETQFKSYLELSGLLFRGIQKNSPIRYAKELKQIIKAEVK